jgi:hypothetical protein
MLKSIFGYIVLFCFSLIYSVVSCVEHVDRDESWRFTVAHFDSVDMMGKLGEWYKNDEANYDWAESYVLQAYMVILEETGDEKYVHKLNDHIQAVLDRRSCVTLDRYDSVFEQFTPAWAKPIGKTDGGTDKYYSWLVSTGMMTYPIVAFVRYIQNRPEIEFSDTTRYTYLEAVEQAVALYDRDWVEYNQPLREGYYKLSPAADSTYLDRVSDPRPGSRAGYPLPLNMQNALGRTLVVLSRVNAISQARRAAYENKAARLARFFKNRLEYFPETDSYRFSYAYHRYGQEEDGRYYYGEYHYGAPIEDINHASLSVDFARLCFENSIKDTQGELIFTERDMARFAHIFTKRIYSGRPEVGHQFYKYIDLQDFPNFEVYYIDSPEYNRYVLDIGSWLPFCRYKPLIYSLVEQKFVHIWHHQKNRIPNPRFLLGVANLIKYDSFRPR